MENPFIPKNKDKLVIVDGRASLEIINSLEEKNLQIIKTIKCEKVDDSISYHPDIVIHPLNHDTIVVEPSVFGYYYDQLKGSGIKVLRGKKNLDNKYPEDIGYNIARLKGLAIHNFKYTDEKILELFKESGLKRINIKQGYSKCSVMIVDEKSAITSDKPIYNKLKDEDYDILLIDQGYIDLPGQSYGFIGGCSGNLSKNEILLSGSLEHHPNKKEICEFVEKKGKKLIFLSTEKIVDIGTIMVLSKR